MTREQRKAMIERKHREMVAQVLARHAAGAAALPHNQKG